MKKCILLALALCAALTLCSCQVNWFGGTEEVPWYVVVIPVLAIALVAFGILKNTTFVCPACGTEFKPRWKQLLSVSIHFMGQRLIRCPHCGRMGFCKRKKNQ